MGVPLITGTAGLVVARGRLLLLGLGCFVMVVCPAVAYRLPADNDIRAAYQVEAIVGARPRPITQRRVQWQARSFAFLPPDEPGKPYGPPAITNSTRKTGLMTRIVNLRKEWQL